MKQTKHRQLLSRSTLTAVLDLRLAAHLGERKIRTTNFRVAGDQGHFLKVCVAYRCQPDLTPNRDLNLADCSPQQTYISISISDVVRQRWVCICKSVAGNAPTQSSLVSVFANASKCIPRRCTDENVRL